MSQDRLTRTASRAEAGEVDSDRPIRLLRLSNSAETGDFVRPEERVGAICARALEAATGRPVDLTVRALWPAPSLPEAVERWLERFEPDVVSLWCAGHPFTYEYLILGAERRFGLVARPLERLADRLAKVEAVSRSEAYGFARRLAARGIRPALRIEPEAAAAAVEGAIRKIAAREAIALVVRGPRFPDVSFLDEASLERAEARRMLVHRRLSVLCARLHVPYAGEEDGLTVHKRRELFMPDGLHSNALGQAEMAAEEAPATVAAWQELHT